MNFKSKILLAKIEGTYDTDPTPAGSDAVLTQGLSSSDYQGDKISRNNDRDSLGAQESINVNPYNTLSFGVEMQGSGTAGTPPAFDALLRACGLGVTNVPATSDTYAPISSSFESITAYFMQLQTNGQHLRHITTGIRGNMSMELSASSFPLFRFDSFMGTYARPTAVTAVTPVVTDYLDPLAVTKDNTPTVTVDSYTACLQSLTVNLNNQLVRYDAPNCRETKITDRAVSGNVIIRAPDIGDKDFFSKLESHAGTSTIAINVVHGTAAGKIITVNMPYVQLQNITETDVNGELAYDLSYVATPSSAGNDELSIVFT